MSEAISELGTRADGRRAQELRSFVARLGVYPQADGSAYLQMGQTKVRRALRNLHNLCTGARRRLSMVRTSVDRGVRRTRRGRLSIVSTVWPCSLLMSERLID